MPRIAESVLAEIAAAERHLQNALDLVGAEDDQLTEAINNSMVQCTHSREVLARDLSAGVYDPATH